jgi:hypothetical protein
MCAVQSLLVESVECPFRDAHDNPSELARLAPAAGRMWAYDFVFDARASGQQLKCLTVAGELTRECLAIDVAGRSSSPT